MEWFLAPFLAKFVPKSSHLTEALLIINGCNTENLGQALPKLNKKLLAVKRISSAITWPPFLRTHLRYANFEYLSFSNCLLIKKNIFGQICCLQGVQN